MIALTEADFFYYNRFHGMPLSMEQMIESQQRIERIQRSLTYLRDLHSRMVS